MKKVFLSITAVTIGFATLAFSPVEKINSISNSIVSDADLMFGTCDTRYQSSDGFTICDREFKEDEIEIANVQLRVLENY